MEVQRIKTEGQRIDPLRNVERLWIAVTTSTVGGAVAGGHLVKPGDPATVEIYVDHLPGVLEQVRTDAHRAAWAQATKMHEVAAAEERKQRKLPPDADMGVTWNGHPSIHLGILGYRKGLPEIETCDVVHPTKQGERMDARAWLALSADKQKEWMVDAPATPMNQAQRANEHLADTIARVFASMQAQGNSGNKNR